MPDDYIPPKLPLWRVLHCAYLAVPEDNPRIESAAQIRALADWLVPEESSETFLPGEDHHNRSKRQQRRQLRQMLLVEAKHAERGE